MDNLNDIQETTQTQTSAIEVRPIRDIFELWTVYGLTHDCYVETGYIRSRPTGLLVHYAEFDHLPETKIWVAIQDNEIVGSISTTVDGPSGIIIEKDYADECRNIRKEGRRAADYWRFVVRKNNRSERQIMMALMVHSGLDLVNRGVRTFLFDVHEKHSGAYVRMFKAKILARREGVPGLEQQHIAAVLLRWDVEHLPERWFNRARQMKPGESISPAPLPIEIPIHTPALDQAKQMAEKYEQRLQAARQRFYGSPVIQKLTSPETPEQELMLFLINYYAFHIIMNRPSESWTRSAHERCAELGLSMLDELFKIHSEQQANLDVLLAADFKALVSLWNKRYPQQPMDAAAMLSRKVPSCVQQFLQNHKNIIMGSQPYQLFAMKYELDRLLLEYGAWTVKRCVKCLGNGVLARLTYLQKKAVLDVEQIQFTWLELGKLLATHPDYLESLVQTGTRTLDAYGDVLVECLTAKLSAPEPVGVARMYENVLARMFPDPEKTELAAGVLKQIVCPECGYGVPFDKFDEINGRCLLCSLVDAPSY